MFWRKVEELAPDEWGIGEEISRRKFGRHNIYMPLFNSLLPSLLTPARLIYSIRRAPSLLDPPHAVSLRYFGHGSLTFDRAVLITTRPRSTIVLLHTSSISDVILAN